VQDGEKFGRREFIKRSAGVIGLGTGIQALQGGFSAQAANAQGKPGGIPSAETSATRYKISQWTGDDFSRGHKLRDAQVPPFPKAPEKTVDFVIIGGGMSGLASAYYLRNHDFLLLEQYDQLGGQSRGSSFQGIGYSMGAAYIGADAGELHDLVEELGLKPVTLDSKKNSWRWDNRWIEGVSGETETLHREFKRLKEQAEPIWKQMGKTEFIPLSDPALVKLDQIPFAGCLTGYDKKLIDLLDSFCKSSNCLGIQRSSALAGYATLNDLVEPTRVFPGGNPAMARALAEKLEADKHGRCVTGAFVWSVEPKENEVSVVYSTADGAMHRVKARFAIVCAPPMVAARIINGIADEQKASMLGFKYGSYLVANLLCKNKVFSGAYDNWVTPPFTFGDIVVAEKPYELNGSYKKEMGSVLTVYQPYEPGTAGRPALLAGDRDAFASSIVEQMSKLVPGLEGSIQEVVLTRWGHAMAVPSVNFFKKMSSLTSTTSGAYALAHCSTQGLACAESAVRAARMASKQALKTKSGIFQKYSRTQVHDEEVNF
jgi:protoporphyrinogen oxidase